MSAEEPDNSSQIEAATTAFSEGLPKTFSESLELVRTFLRHPDYSSLPEQDLRSTLLDEAFASFFPEVVDAGFTVCCQISDGGLGWVFKVKRETKAPSTANFSPEFFALKVLKHEEHSDLFSREAEILEKLRIPGVVNFDKKLPFSGKLRCFTMEYVDGKSLEQLISEENVHTRDGSTLPIRVDGTTDGYSQTPRERFFKILSFGKGRNRSAFKPIAAFGREVAKVLVKVHNEGIIHADVKPANIICCSQKDEIGFRLIDFGIAREKRSDGFSAGSQAAFGTLKYMSPEQAGKKLQLDEKTDVYSLANVMYKMISLRDPVIGESIEETHDSRMSPAPLAEMCTSVHADLAAVIDAARCQAVAKRPTMQEFADELGRFIEGKPTRSRPVSTVVKAGMWIQRHPGLSVSISVSAVLALCLLVTLLFRARDLSIVRQQSFARGLLSVAESQALDDPVTAFVLASEAVTLDRSVAGRATSLLATSSRAVFSMQKVAMLDDIPLDGNIEGPPFGRSPEDSGLFFFEPVKASPSSADSLEPASEAILRVNPSTLEMKRTGARNWQQVGKIEDLAVYGLSPDDKGYLIHRKDEVWHLGSTLKCLQPMTAAINDLLFDKVSAACLMNDSELLVLDCSNSLYKLSRTRLADGKCQVVCCLESPHDVHAGDGFCVATPTDQPGPSQLLRVQDDGTFSQFTLPGMALAVPGRVSNFSINQRLVLCQTAGSPVIDRFRFSVDGGEPVKLSPVVLDDHNSTGDTWSVCRIFCWSEDSAMVVMWDINRRKFRFHRINPRTGARQFLTEMSDVCLAKENRPALSQLSSGGVLAISRGENYECILTKIDLEPLSSNQQVVDLADSPIIEAAKSSSGELHFAATGGYCVASARQPNDSHVHGVPHVALSTPGEATPKLLKGQLKAGSFRSNNLVLWDNTNRELSLYRHEHSGTWEKGYSLHVACRNLSEVLPFPRSTACLVRADGVLWLIKDDWSDITPVIPLSQAKQLSAVEVIGQSGRSAEVDSLRVRNLFAVIRNDRTAAVLEINRSYECRLHELDGDSERKIAAIASHISKDRIATLRENGEVALHEWETDEFKQVSKWSLNDSMRKNPRLFFSPIGDKLAVAGTLDNPGSELFEAKIHYFSIAAKEEPICVDLGKSHEHDLKLTWGVRASDWIFVACSNWLQVVSTIDGSKHPISLPQKIVPRHIDIYDDKLMVLGENTEEGKSDLFRLDISGRELPPRIKDLAEQSFSVLNKNLVFRRCLDLPTIAVEQERFPVVVFWNDSSQGSKELWFDSPVKFAGVVADPYSKPIGFVIVEESGVITCFDANGMKLRAFSEAPDAVPAPIKSAELLSVNAVLVRTKTKADPRVFQNVFSVEMTEDEKPPWRYFVAAGSNDAWTVLSRWNGLKTEEAVHKIQGDFPRVVWNHDRSSALFLGSSCLYWCNGSQIVVHAPRECAGNPTADDALFVADGDKTLCEVLWTASEGRQVLAKYEITDSCHEVAAFDISQAVRTSGEIAWEANTLLHSPPGVRFAYAGEKGFCFISTHEGRDIVSCLPFSNRSGLPISFSVSGDFRLSSPAEKVNILLPGVTPESWKLENGILEPPFEQPRNLSNSEKLRLGLEVPKQQGLHAWGR